MTKAHSGFFTSVFQPSSSVPGLSSVSTSVLLLFDSAPRPESSTSSNVSSPPIPCTISQRRPQLPGCTGVYVSLSYPNSPSSTPSLRELRPLKSPKSETGTPTQCSQRRAEAMKRSGFARNKQLKPTIQEAWLVSSLCHKETARFLKPLKPHGWRSGW
jgi:hypothetical protein